MDLIKLIAINFSFTFAIIIGIIFFLKNMKRTFRDIVVTIALIALTTVLPHIGLLYGSIIIVVSIIIALLSRSKTDEVYKTMESFGFWMQVSIVGIETYNHINLWTWLAEYLK